MWASAAAISLEVNACRAYVDVTPEFSQWFTLEFWVIEQTVGDKEQAISPYPIKRQTRVFGLLKGIAARKPRSSSH
jgi:hypothetical protein